MDAIWLEDGVLADFAVVDSGYDPHGAADQLANRRACDAIVATGYGRHGARERLGCAAVTEIKAYATGAHALVPAAAAVLDIGGQDTKVIALNAAGRVADFEMNDKCAAGTGKFLEVMSRALGFGLEEMALAALSSAESVPISSMCTVFAESEVTGLMHRGEERGRIARGLHESIARRTLGSLKRVGVGAPLLFAGGVAKNEAMLALLTEGFPGEVLLAPTDAQIVGAYGAALCAKTAVEGDA